jgi:hypothetical protein
VADPQQAAVGLGAETAAAARLGRAQPAKVGLIANTGTSVADRFCFFIFIGFYWCRSVLRIRIRDPGSEIREKFIPDPGSRG